VTAATGVRIINITATERTGYHDQHDGWRPVHGAPAVGVPLHTNGQLGADLLHIKAGQQFPVHTHPGDHLLYCVRGRGTITVAQITYEIRPGDLYMVDGLTPHAVGAIDDHSILAIGSPHKPVDSPERMTWCDWQGNILTTPLAVDPENRRIDAPPLRPAIP
jgi:quercetin dioxygenase-like cupin family protein